jgi:hypothetical protein
MFHLDTYTWYDRTYGNTYTSARLSLDYGDRYELVAVFPFQYANAEMMAHAVIDITDERPVLHSSMTLKKEAVRQGQNFHGMLNWTAQRTPSHQYLLNSQFSYLVADINNKEATRA